MANTILRMARPFAGLHLREVGCACHGPPRGRAPSWIRSWDGRRSACGRTVPTHSPSPTTGPVRARRGGPQHDGVAVLEERALRPVVERHGLGAAPRQLEEAPAGALLRPRDRARPEQVAAAQRRAVDRSCAPASAPATSTCRGTRAARRPCRSSRPRRARPGRMPCRHRRRSPRRAGRAAARGPGRAAAPVPRAARRS